MAQAGPQDDPGDDTLMTLAAAGQQSAYVRLVQRYERRVRGFARLLVRDDTLAYDIAQEVFLKIWKRREQYQSQGRFKEFLFMVARNECRSVRRKRTLLELFGMTPALEQLPAARVAAEEPCDDERLPVIAAALTRLPEKFRVPLTLRFVEGLGYAEIARVIGRTESTARSRIFYGLKELAALLPAEVMS